MYPKCSKQGKEFDLKLLYLNGRSILRKMDELKIVVEKGKYDFVAITETWLNK